MRESRRQDKEGSFHEILMKDLIDSLRDAIDQGHDIDGTESPHLQKQNPRTSCEERQRKRTNKRKKERR